MDAPLPAQHDASAGLWPKAKTRRSLRVWASGYAPTAGGRGGRKNLPLPCPQDRPDCRVPGRQTPAISRTTAAGLPGGQHGTQRMQKLAGASGRPEGLSAGPRFVLAQAPAEGGPEGLVPDVSEQSRERRTKRACEETRPTKAPGHGRTQERYGEKRARVKRHRSVTLRVSSTNRRAAYGRTVPGALGDQPRPRSTGPSGQGVTETGISRAKVVSPKGRSAS